MQPTHLRCQFHALAPLTSRTLAEEDLAAAGGGSGGGSTARPLAKVAGPECEDLYMPGKAEAAGFGGPKARLYVVSKAGYFPDVCEGLAHKHLEKGDKVRGGGRGIKRLVTAECMCTCVRVVESGGLFRNESRITMGKYCPFLLVEAHHTRVGQLKSSDHHDQLHDPAFTSNCHHKPSSCAAPKYILIDTQQ